jgi:hypothetical protein
MIGIPDAVRTHSIAFAAECSAKTGKPVSLPLAEALTLELSVPESVN